MGKLFDQPAGPHPDQPLLVGQTIDPAIGPMLRPTDFALVPCQGLAKDVRCSIIAAGGKRILVGAPAGIGAGYIPGELILPDAVLLFSLDAEGLEGLDEVRNASWAAGRSAKLRVSSVNGVEDVVDGINAAFVLPDAISYVSGGTARGYDRAPLTALPLTPGEIAFDTGDLVVRAVSAGIDRMAFLVSYAGIDVLLAPCVSNLEVEQNWPDRDYSILCSEHSSEQAGTFSAPLTEVILFNGDAIANIGDK
ncbi:MAG: hypothetical protein AAGK23_14080, partial [Pseudomonadota bacterium]